MSASPGTASQFVAPRRTTETPAVACADDRELSDDAEEELEDSANTEEPGAADVPRREHVPAFVKPAPSFCVVRFVATSFPIKYCIRRCFSHHFREASSLAAGGIVSEPRLKQEQDGMLAFQLLTQCFILVCTAAVAVPSTVKIAPYLFTTAASPLARTRMSKIKCMSLVTQPSVSLTDSHAIAVTANVSVQGPQITFQPLLYRDVMPLSEFLLAIRQIRGGHIPVATCQ